MIDFFEMLVNASDTDFSILLGDMYEPTIAAISVGAILIPIAFCCQTFTRIIAAMFGGKN